VGAARLVGEDGGRLEAGWTVMAGGATAAEALTSGLHVRLEAQNMGSVSFDVI
jgi:2-oxo-3-hexenedioate decarboxylase